MAVTQCGNETQNIIYVTYVLGAPGVWFGLINALYSLEIFKAL
jgi:hypothetical protein